MRVWETSQQAKIAAVGRQKTDDFTERVPLSYACYETYHITK